MLCRRLGASTFEEENDEEDLHPRPPVGRCCGDMAVPLTKLNKEEDEAEPSDDLVATAALAMAHADCTTSYKE